MKKTPEQTREEQNRAKALAIRREKESKAKALTRRRSKSNPNPTAARISSPVLSKPVKPGQSPQAVALIQQTLKFPSKKELSGQTKPPLHQPGNLTDQQKRTMKLTEDQKQRMERKKAEALAKKTRNKDVPPPPNPQSVISISSKFSPQKSAPLKLKTSSSTSNPPPTEEKKKEAGLTQEQRLQIEEKRAAALARKNRSKPPPPPFSPSVAASKQSSLDPEVIFSSLYKLYYNIVFQVHRKNEEEQCRGLLDSLERQHQVGRELGDLSELTDLLLKIDQSLRQFSASVLSPFSSQFLANCGFVLVERAVLDEDLWEEFILILRQIYMAAWLGEVIYFIKYLISSRHCYLLFRPRWTRGRLSVVKPGRWWRV